MASDVGVALGAISLALDVGVLLGAISSALDMGVALVLSVLGLESPADVLVPDK